MMVMMPQAGWDATVLLLLESSRTLKREGNWDLAVEVLGSIIPAMLDAASIEVRLLYEEEMTGGLEQRAEAVA